MELINEFEDYLKAGDPDKRVAAEVMKNVALMMAPITPHLAEEIWQLLGGVESVHLQKWPVTRQEFLVEKEVVVVVQVNGKTRERLVVDRGTDKETVLKLALASERISKAIANKEIKKVIFVPDKILNIVV
jgi:leucyl-tRNA synthetase